MRTTDHDHPSAVYKESIAAHRRLRSLVAWTIFPVMAAVVAWQGSALTTGQHERQAVEAERDAQLRRAELIIISAPVALITCNAQQQIIIANPACEEVFGYPPEELIGQSVSVLIPPEDREEHDGFMVAAGEKAKNGPDNHMMQRTVVAAGWHIRGHKVTVSVSIRVIKYGGDVEFIASFRQLDHENHGGKVEEKDISPLAQQHREKK